MMLHLDRHTRHTRAGAPGARLMRVLPRRAGEVPAAALLPGPLEQWARVHRVPGGRAGPAPSRQRSGRRHHGRVQQQRAERGRQLPGRAALPAARLATGLSRAGLRFILHSGPLCSEACHTLSAARGSTCNALRGRIAQDKAARARHLANELLTVGSLGCHSSAACCSALGSLPGPLTHEVYMGTL